MNGVAVPNMGSFQTTIGSFYEVVLGACEWSFGDIASIQLSGLEAAPAAALADPSQVPPAGHAVRRCAMDSSTTQNANTKPWPKLHGEDFVLS